MTIQAIPYVSLLGLMFGSTLIASRFGIGQFHPLVFVGLRMLVASLCYLAIYTLYHRRQKWPADLRLWYHAGLLGVLGTAVPMTAIMISLQYQSSGMTAVLLTAGPAITVLMAHFFLADETLTLRKGIGVVLALGGALFLAVRGESGLHDVRQSNPLGYALVFLAMIAGGAMTVYVRRYMREFASFEVSSIRVFVSTLVLLPASMLLVGIDLQAVNGQGYLILVYAAMVTNVFGFLLSFYNIKRFGATAAAMALYVVPLVASVGGVLLLDEKITVGMLVGIGFIVLGIGLINRQQHKLDHETG